jgi:hypothetical protein
MVRDLIGWLEEVLLPARMACLDEASPAFEWRRRATYWQAQARAHTESTFGARPEFVLAHDFTPWGLSVNDTQRVIPWLCEPSGRPPQSPAALYDVAAALAAPLEIDIPPDLAPLSDARWRSLHLSLLLESLMTHAQGVFQRAKLGRAYMHQVCGLTHEQIETLPLGMFYAPALRDGLTHDGFDASTLRRLGFDAAAERWSRRLLIPWRAPSGRLLTVAAVSVEADLDASHTASPSSTPSPAPLESLWPHTDQPLLFGLDLALRHPDGAQHLIIVERLLDAVCLHAHDLRRFIALGASPWRMRDDHWRSLASFDVSEVTLSLSPPEATLHALEQRRDADADLLTPYVLSLSSLSQPSDAHTAASLVATSGPEALQRALTSQRQPAARFAMEAALGTIQPTDSPEVRQQALIRWFHLSAPALAEADAELWLALKLAQKQTGFQVIPIERLRHQCAPDEPAPPVPLTINTPRPQDSPDADFNTYLDASLDAAWDAARVSGICLGLISAPPTRARVTALLSWLMRQAVRDGLRLLWVAPSADALDLASRVALSLAPTLCPKGWRTRVISPDHGLPADVASASLDDDLCLCVSSTITTHPTWAAAFSDGRRCITALDEAHLMTSSGVRQWVAELKRPLPIRLLGTTSRPVSALAAEPHLLQDTFCDALLFSADAATARAQGRLLPCAPRLLHTGFSPESLATPEDWADFTHTLTPSPSWLARVAAIPDRDDPLLDALCDPTALPFRKCLILTLGTGHTLRLLNKLQARGRAAAHLLPTNPDSNPLLRAPTLRRFCDPQSDLSLLLTPFNTAPSALHAALRAADALVIAHLAPAPASLRALLGLLLSPDPSRPSPSDQPLVAHVWLLCDRWSDALPHLQQPILPILDLLSSAPDDDPADPAARLEREAAALLPWDVALSIRRAIDAHGLPLDHSTLPLGWWILLQASGERVCLPIHAQHRDAWTTLYQHLAALHAHSPAALQDPSLPERLRKPFLDLAPPAPDLNSLRALIHHALHHGAARPLFAPLPDLSDITPTHLAARLWAQNTSLTAAAADVHVRYTHHPLASLLYPTERDLRRAVFAALDLLAEPLPKTPNAYPSRWSEPLPYPTPPHDLDALCQATAARALASRPDPTLSPSLSPSATPPLPALRARWTHLPLHGWASRVIPPATPDQPLLILVNRALNTPATSADALLTILWDHYKAWRSTTFCG